MSLQEGYWTIVECLAKFRVLASEITRFVGEGTKVQEKIALCFSEMSRSSARTFARSFARKIGKTKNEIRAFRLHYFFTIWCHKSVFKFSLQRAATNRTVQGNEFYFIIHLKVNLYSYHELLSQKLFTPMAWSDDSTQLYINNCGVMRLTRSCYKKMTH